MNTYEAAEALRQLVLAHDLPHTDMTLFGMRCPYCGKSDRIRQLEQPRDVSGGLSEEEKARYGEMFARLAANNGGLGVCKFCHNPLRLAQGSQPTPLEGTD